MNNLCKICGSNTGEFTDLRLNINYYYCKNCEFISRDENSIVSAEEEKREYDLHENSFEDEGYVNFFRDFLNNAVVKFMGYGKDALDFGSGPEPVLAKVLADEWGYNIDIYDLYYSPQKIYKGKKYDLITSTEVVEHLANPLEYFKLFKTLLKQNGIIAIMTLFHPKNDEKFCRWHYHRDKTHISFFTPKTMEFIAKEINMKIVYCDNKRYCTFLNNMNL